MDVTVTGAAELAAAFEAAAGEADRLDLSRAGDRVRAQLESLSPRLTGTLSGSWGVDAVSGHVAIGSDLIYAAVQNYGSGHVPALHYVDRAAELADGEAQQVISDEVDRLVSRF